MPIYTSIHTIPILFVQFEENSTSKTALFLTFETLLTKSWTGVSLAPPRSSNLDQGTAGCQDCFLKTEKAQQESDLRHQNMENFECNSGEGSDQFYDIKGEYLEWYSDSEQMKTEPEAKIRSREKQLEAEKLELQKKLKLNLTRYISCLKKFRHMHRQTSRTQAQNLFTKGDSISSQSKETQTEETQIKETEIEKTQIKGTDTKETQTKVTQTQETQTEPEPDQGFVSPREIEQDSRDADIPKQAKALRKAEEEKEASEKNAWRRISLILDEEVQSFLRENHSYDEEHLADASTLSPLNFTHPAEVDCFTFPQSRSYSPPGPLAASTPLQLENDFPQGTRAPAATMAQHISGKARKVKQVEHFPDFVLLSFCHTSLILTAGCILR